MWEFLTGVKTDPDHTVKYEQHVRVKVKCQIERAQMMRSLPYLQTVTLCPAY